MTRINKVTFALAFSAWVLARGVQVWLPVRSVEWRLCTTVALAALVIQVLLIVLPVKVRRQA